MTLHPIPPNWHVIVIHYPLALLSLGLLIEIFSPLWRKGAFRKAGRWMLLLGTLAAIPAVTTGLYAMKSVVGGHGNWAHKTAGASLTPAQWSLLIHHLWWNVAGVACFIVAVILWLGGSDRFRRRLHWPLLIVAIAGMACMICGAWHGGEMVYRQGISVASITPAAAPAAAPTTAPAVGWIRFDPSLTRVIPPLQLHLLLAGLTFALAAVALGLSFRALAEYRRADQPASEASDLTHDQRLIDALRGDEMTVMHPLAYPPARFWVLALLLGIATAAAGLWNMNLWTWPKLQDLWIKYHREFAHAVGGSSIILLSLLLALATRLARRRGWLLGILSLLLILAIAAQIWLGVLLAFDGMGGPVWRFN